MYNSLKCAIQLEEAGVPRKQAEVHVQILSEMIESNFATKQDLKDVRQEIKDLGAELRQEMSFMKHELKTDITDVRTEMRMLEHRITIKLGTIVSIAIGVAVTLTKLVA